MLQAVYKTSPYTFYLSTEDNRIDTSKTDTDNLLYLFKLTNDMSGEIQYAFSPVQVIYNRYSKFVLYHNTTPLYYAGRVNLVPNGYWNYKVYEYSGNTTTGSSCQTIPNPATGNIGDYTIKNTAGATLSTANFTPSGLYDQSVAVDTTSLGSFEFKLLDLCSVAIKTLNFTYAAQVFPFATFNNALPLAFDNVVQTATGITFDIICNAPVGYKYELQQGTGVTTIITASSQPQTNSFSYSQIGQPDLAANKIVIKLTDSGGSAVGGMTDLYAYPISNPTSYYGFVMPIAVTHGGIDTAGGGAVLNGKIYFTASYNGVGMSTSKSYYTLQGLTTQGKLYVSEPSGEEQVQYNQHPDPSGTNYIWYGQ